MLSNKSEKESRIGRFMARVQLRCAANPAFRPDVTESRAEEEAVLDRPT